MSLVKQNILIAFGIFKNKSTLDFNKIYENLRQHWFLKIEELTLNTDSSVVFSVENTIALISKIDTPLPTDEIITNAKEFTWYWPEAEAEINGHDSHIIVSLMSDDKSDLERHILLTKILAAILSTSDCTAIYQEKKLLLHSKDVFLADAERLKLGDYPINLWIYFGLQKSEIGNCIFSYGMNDFNKQDIEILDSKFSHFELLQFLDSICEFIIGEDISINAGETIGLTHDQKIKITESKGRFLEGLTLKLSY